MLHSKEPKRSAINKTKWKKRQQQQQQQPQNFSVIALILNKMRIEYQDIPYFPFGTFSLYFMYSHLVNNKYIGMFVCVCVFAHGCGM